MALSIEVWPGETPGSGSGSVLRTLTTDINRTFRTPVNDPGSGSVSVERGSTDASYCRTYRWLKFRLDGTARFAMRIAPRVQKTIAEGEEADEDLTLAGPGALATWKDAVVFPHAKADLLRDPGDTRYFNFASPDYPDSGSAPWVAATQRWRQDSALSPYGTDAPNPWPDTSAYWIWSNAYVDGRNPLDRLGYSYFRTTVTTAADGDYTMFVTADDGYQLWVDGVLMDEQSQAFQWRDAHEIPLFLKAGVHVVAIRGENVSRPSASTNGAAVLFAMYSTINGGNLNTLVLHSDNTWQALDYPTNPPGMTAGEIVRVLRTEAQARGAIAPWLVSFADATDSNTVAWTKELELGFSYGETYLDVLRLLAESFVDLRVDYETFTLGMVNKGGYDTTPARTLAVAVDLLDLTHDFDPAYVTDLLVHLADGTYSRKSSGVATPAPGSGANPVIEALLEAGSAPSSAAATGMADGAFDRFANGKVITTFGVLTSPWGDTPAWREHDTITVPDTELANASTNVQAITVADRSPDEDGVVDGSQTFLIEAWQHEAGAAAKTVVAATANDGTSAGGGAGTAAAVAAANDPTVTGVGSPAAGVAAATGAASASTGKSEAPHAGVATAVAAASSSTGKTEEPHAGASTATGAAYNATAVNS